MGITRTVLNYMENNGCSLEEAANELALNWDEVFDDDLWDDMD